MASKRPTTRTAVDIYTSTRDLLKRIKAMPGNGRSCPVIMDILVRDEAVRLGLIEAPGATNLDEKACCESFCSDEGKCPKCGEDLFLDLVGGAKYCRNRACCYRC